MKAKRIVSPAVLKNAIFHYICVWPFCEQSSLSIAQCRLEKGRNETAVAFWTIYICTLSIRMQANEGRKGRIWNYGIDWFDLNLKRLQRECGILISRQFWLWRTSKLFRLFFTVMSCRFFGYSRQAVATKILLFFGNISCDIWLVMNFMINIVSGNVEFLFCFFFVDG